MKTRNEHDLVHFLGLWIGFWIITINKKIVAGVDGVSYNIKICCVQAFCTSRVLCDKLKTSVGSEDYKFENNKKLKLVELERIEPTRPL